MADDSLADVSETDRLTPEAAFGLLSHSTRMAAMTVLWEHDRPLQFSEVADRAGISDTGNFNYHFGKLVGHFVRKSGETYELTRSGRQAMTAVLAGDVTDRPRFDPVTLAKDCPFCEADIELHHDSDLLQVRCSSCSGIFHGEWEEIPGHTRQSGTLAVFGFPAAGLRDRDPPTVLDAALTRLASRATDVGRGLCPDCAAPVERWTEICTNHDDREGVCEHCGSRSPGVVMTRCETCRNTIAGVLVLAGLADPRLRTYFLDHGHDLLDPTWETLQCYVGADERVRSADPVDYEAVWTVDGDRLAVRFDGDARITDVQRESGT